MPIENCIFVSSRECSQACPAYSAKEGRCKLIMAAEGINNLAGYFESTQKSSERKWTLADRIMSLVEKMAGVPPEERDFGRKEGE